MSRIKKITHQNIEIVYTDLSNLDIEEAKVIMIEAADLVGSYAPKTAYSMIDFEKMRFNRSVIETIKEISKRNEPYIVATAVLGLTSMTKLIAKSAILIGGRNAKVFDDIEEAKDWLVVESKKI